MAELNLRAVQGCRENVEVVSIGCLFKDREDEDEDGRLGKEVSDEACWKIVPFLVGFPKLREAMLYGIVKKETARFGGHGSVSLMNVPRKISSRASG